MKTVNNLGALCSLKKLSQFQKRILRTLLDNEDHGIIYDELSFNLAKATNNLIRNKTNDEKIKDFKESYKKEFERTPSEKHHLLTQLLRIDRILLENNLRKNSWRYKKFTIKDSFRASLSRSIKRLEDRGLVRSYNFCIPHYYGDDHAIDDYPGNYYRKYIELTSIGNAACIHLLNKDLNGIMYLFK